MYIKITLERWKKKFVDLCNNPEKIFPTVHLDIKEFILNFIKESSNGRTREEINDFIYQQMNDHLETKNSRVRTALTYLRRKGFIENICSDTKSVWIVK